MKRLPDWEERLSVFIAENHTRPFCWGEWDCILFAAAAAEAMTGEDIAAAYRGKYHDKAGAAAILKAQGQGTLLRTIDSVLERRKPSRARRGDFVWFEGSVGICVGSTALFVGEERLASKAGAVMREGLLTIPRALWTKAWTV